MPTRQALNDYDVASVNKGHMASLLRHPSTACLHGHGRRLSSISLLLGRLPQQLASKSPLIFSLTVCLVTERRWVKG
jgi:hypothetical protein